MKDLQVIDNIKQQVIRGGKELLESDLIARTWGNVSCRVGKNHFAITASGKAYDTLTEDDIVVVDLKNLSYEGTVKPSGEKRVHQTIYKMRPDAEFIIHTHQTYASAVAAMGIDIIKLRKNYPLLGEVVCCSGYGLPGTVSVAENVARALKHSRCKAILMSNHGAVCFGKDYDEAFAIARELEEACKELLDSLPLKKLNNHIVRAYLDDFAQLIGPSLDMSDYDPAELARKLGEDEDAVKMVVYKNSLAAVAAKGTDAKPIKRSECVIMRMIYKKKYSKLKNK